MGRRIGNLVRGEAPDEIGLGMFYEDKGTLLESLEKLDSVRCVRSLPDLRNSLICTFTYQPGQVREVAAHE